MKEICGQYGAGVESIEFSISDNLDQLERKMERYQKRLEQMGNPPLTLHGPFLDLNPASFDSRIRKVTMERFDQCYQAGIRLGAKKDRISFRDDPYGIFPGRMGGTNRPVFPGVFKRPGRP